MQQEPSPGRIVHYVLPEEHRNAGEIRPAIIVRVFNSLGHPSNPGMANLQVFLDGPNDEPDVVPWVGSANFAPAEERRPGTWHWPPRV
jgi:hypothetical protein